MSRNIDFTKPLSGDDAQYVKDRPWLLADQELQGNTVVFEDDDFGLEDDEDGEAAPVDAETEYRSLTVAELKTLISDRNGEKGEDEEEIDPASDRKDDLVAALLADDQLDAE